MASKPHKGTVVAEFRPGQALPDVGGRTNDGTWRPDTGFKGDGLKLTMRRAEGVTRPGVLRVPLRFQVPPMGDFRRPYRTPWSTYDTIADGQRSRPMGSQLLELPIETMLMDRLAAEATSGVVVWDGAMDPERILKELRFIAGSDDARRGKGTPFRLTITQTSVWDEPVVNMLATLTSVEPTQRANAIATEYLSVTFLEYEDHRAKVAKTAPVRKEARMHPLVAGDTLYAISTKYIHRASGWQRIAAANGIKGVDPGSAEALANWAKRHHKKKLKIPAVELEARQTSGAAGGAGLP